VLDQRDKAEEDPGREGGKDEQGSPRKRAGEGVLAAAVAEARGSEREDRHKDELGEDQRDEDLDAPSSDRPATRPDHRDEKNGHEPNDDVD
jgi:hypothetical protein